MEVLKTSTGTLFKDYLPHSCKLLEYRTSIFQKNIHKQVPTTGFFDVNSSSFATYSNSSAFVARIASKNQYLWAHADYLTLFKNDIDKISKENGLSN